MNVHPFSWKDMLKKLKNKHNLFYDHNSVGKYYINIYDVCPGICNTGECLDVPVIPSRDAKGIINTECNPSSFSLSSSLAGFYIKHRNIVTFHDDICFAHSLPIEHFSWGPGILEYTECSPFEPSLFCYWQYALTFLIHKLLGLILQK